MKFVVAALCVLAYASAVSFDDWKLLHGKSYATETEHKIRQNIWEKNLKFIIDFNMLGNASYELDMNEFGDLLPSEFARLYRSKPIDITRRFGVEHKLSGEAVPDSMDWREKGYVTPIKNQGQCGSCWAFSTTGSVEGQHFNSTGKLVSLSEQNLVDCSRAEGNEGCNGGLMDDAFKYIIKNGGIDTEESYPYKGVDGTCKFKKDNVGATISSYRDVKQGSEDDLKDAAGSVGPISVAIDASDASFQFYRKGVYDPRICSSKNLDHGVLVVGYGVEDGSDYWLVKNSWGESWGMKGYINMARNKDNKCGIATSASYPIV